MKNQVFSDDILLQKMRSTSRLERNEALKSLYNDNTINFKIREMAREYNYKADADDALQDGVILLDEMVRDGRFRGESSVKTFLISICRNIMRNKVRSAEKVVFKEEIKETDLSDTSVRDATPEEAILIVEASEKEQKRDAILRGLLTEMTDRCQDVLRLYYYESYNMAKIALERGLKNANQAGKAADQCRKQLFSLISEQPTLMNFLKAGL